MSLKIIDKTKPEHAKYHKDCDGCVIIQEDENGVVVAPQEIVDELFDLTPEQRKYYGYEKIEKEIKDPRNREKLKKAAPEKKILSSPKSIATIDQAMEDKAAKIKRTEEEFNQKVAERLAGNP